MKQALIVIDMQNGFLNPESPLCIRGARATVPACARAITCTPRPHQICAKITAPSASFGSAIGDM